MTLYPFYIDSDTELPRVDDDLSDFEAKHINAIRDAIFAIEKALGTNIHGSLNSLKERLSVFLADNGMPKSEVLSQLGLVTLPIDDSKIGNNAGIKESKLSLDHSTSDLYTLIIAESNQLSSIILAYNSLISDFGLHIAGSIYLSDNSTAGRHTANQIDLLNKIIDKNGSDRDADNVQQALETINESLINHQNSTELEHIASAISVNFENFQEIPKENNTVQKVLEYLDSNEILNMGLHRAIQHSDAIPKIQRTESFESNYNYIIVPETSVTTYLVHNPNNGPVDSLSIGDDVVKFNPDNSNYLFDSYFSQVKPGDIVSINYKNGITSDFLIDSIRYSPGNEWIIRINGINLYDVEEASATIYRPHFNFNSEAILASAAVNIRNSTQPIYTDILTSIIVADPKGASAVGLGLDLGQLNSDHYKLYLELYPTGKPTEKIIKLPYIDVTGNAGSTPGKYTLDSIVHATNNKFREIGYNYRFIAFSYNGEFGICLADSINGASFAIINGTNSSGTLETGDYTENVIGGSGLDSFDPFGFGVSGANIASPTFQNSWQDAIASKIPTKVISPFKKRYYFVNGIKKDSFAKTYLSNLDGSWDGYISAKVPVGNSNVEVTYSIDLDLRSSGLKKGKTIVIQPSIDFNDPNYNDIDYGRFIIKDINFNNCPGESFNKTLITVVNGIHAFGTGFGNSAEPPLPVKIYFSYDSVGFDNQNIVDTNSAITRYSRFYEIFIDQFGKTFSHERLRFPKQNETSILLGTTNLHVINVSSKLRGYYGSNPSVLNKYIRFFISNYNSNSGEFDGYIGKINGNSIEKIGQIVKAKKNIPCKFYDETGIDYIELLYSEGGVSPGSNILSSNIGRYVDIELFPSLKLHDEIFPIASCEVTWSQDANEDIVQYVSDIREFGSISEIDFTNSAKNFISAVDKHIHQNGIIRGFDLDYISEVADSGEIYFKGGTALINGNIVLSNNGSVTIPRIYSVGAGLPQNIQWVICVNEFGNFVPILITNSKQQFYATPDSGNYFIDSFTFSELLFARKDLVPIRLINVTVGSLTISSNIDLRKFINSQDLTAPITWAQDSQIIGNFYSFDALKQWINFSSGVNQEVIVRGDFVLDDEFDFTGFTKKVFFDGKNSKFNINSEKGILIGSNVCLKNFNFYYFGQNSSYTEDALISANNGNACIVNTIGQNIENITIENCDFFNEEDSQRPPFIFFQLQKGQVIKNVSILNNKFNDINSSSNLTKSQAAIVFFTTNSGSSSDPALLKNVNILNNICNYSQGIYITTKAGTTGAEAPGINCINCNIENNDCGIIGIVPSGHISTLADFTNVSNILSLSIKNNKCHIIGNFYNEGNEIIDVGELEYGQGNLFIENNKCSWIFIQNKDAPSSYQRSSLRISKNTLIASSTNYLNLFSPSLPNYAIYVINNSTEISNTIISENFINFGRYDGITYTYNRGISCDSSALITENIIKGLGSSATGINATGGDGNSNKYYTISNNQIYRENTSISKYIALPNSGTKVFGICKNNFFDSHTVDDSSETVISGSFNQLIVDNNINQTKTIRASIALGNWGSGSTSPLIYGDATLTASHDISGLRILEGGSSDFGGVQINYDSSIAGDDRYIFWTIQLDSIVPKDAYITKISITAQTSVTFDISDLTISLIGTSLSIQSQDGGSPTTITNSGNTLTITVANRNFIVNNSIRPCLRMNIKVNRAAGGGNLNIDNLLINYRW